MSIGILVYGKKFSQKFFKGLLLVQFYSIYILMTFPFLSMRDFLSMDRPLSVCALQCTVPVHFFRISLQQSIFFHVALFSRCVFMFHLFHTAPFPSSTFCVVISTYCTFFPLHSFYVVHHFMFHGYTLQCFRFASFSYCTLCMLQVFSVAPFPELQPGSSQTSKMQSFAILISKAIKYCCKALHLRCSQGPHYVSTISMLQFFHVAVFSCPTFLILKNIENERKKENTTKRRPYTKHDKPVSLLF